VSTIMGRSPSSSLSTRALTPIPEMADEARDVAQPPSDVSHGGA
jgi:hypothetical protein